MWFPHASFRYRNVDNVPDFNKSITPSFASSQKVDMWNNFG